MIVFPVCKINLGLHITGKRPDGYHNLQTLFYPVPVSDVLEILPAPNFAFTQSGLTVQGDASQNLCVQAYHLLQQHLGTLPAVHIHLHKCIPMGAGLGGGSSNGSYTLTALNTLLDLHLSGQELENLALQLGSDCPFFITAKPCLAEGRGEVMTPANINLDGMHLVLVNTGIHINTGWAFGQIVPQANRPSLAEALEAPVSSWQHLLTNDFEAPVLEAHALLRTIKQQMLDAGAVYAAMSGSGSTMFGLFEQAPPLRVWQQAGWWVQHVVLGQP